MLDLLRDFFRRLGGPDDVRHFGEDDARLALAALLVGFRFPARICRR